jgi:hypothetical protein
MTTTTFDYLGAEPAIIARLQAKMPSINPKNIRSEADIATLSQGQLGDLGIVVIYGGERIEPDESHLATEAIQTWLVVLSVRQPNDRTGAQTRTVAGPLITEIDRALVGYEVSPFHMPLKRVTAPRPQLQPGGTLWLPLAYQTRVFVSAGR